MSTATTTRSTARRMRAQKPDDDVTQVADPAGEQPLKDSHRTEKTLDQRLAVFGFKADPDWSAQVTSDATALLDSWELDMIEVGRGIPIAVERRLSVPSWLDGLKCETSEQIVAASQAGRNAAGVPDMTSDFNPYPVGTALADAWDDALVKAVSKQNEPVASEPVAEPTNSRPEIPAPAKPAPETPAERQAREQQEAIEALQAEMEDANSDAADLDDRLDSLKSELKGVKADFDDACLRGRQAARKLKMARRGFFDRPSAQKTLPGLSKDPVQPPFNGDSLDVDLPSGPPVDEGAAISLDYLKKGDLQEYIPGTPEDRGLSGKQVENLKEAIGQTVGDLENFMKDNGGGEWWLRALGDKAEGFGKATRDKLVDAYEIIRRKFPMPSPDDVPSEPSPASPVRSSDDVKHAIEQLGIVINDCESYQEEPAAHEDGKTFCASVAKRAAEVKQTIIEKQEVTQPQADAIKAWRTAVDRWFDGLPV